MKRNHDDMTKHSNPWPLAALCAALTLGAAAALAPARAALPASGAFTVLHTVSLPVQEVNGLQMQELSGLAWDADEQLLYAVSDRGHVFHLRLKLGAERIESVLPVLGASLRDARNAGRKFNAEGLAVVNADNGVKGDTQLVVALENGPAVVRCTPRGEVIADVELPPALRDRNSYRSKNKRLESIAVHPRHGLLMAPEEPLAGEPQTRHTLYATNGNSWSFEALRAESDLKAIETLPDGSLLVLERVGTDVARQAALRRIDPAACGAGSSCAAGDAPAATAVIADGNFEGMALLSATQLLLVSDGGIERQGAASFALVGMRSR